MPETLFDIYRTIRSYLPKEEASLMDTAQQQLEASPEREPVLRPVRIDRIHHPALRIVRSASFIYFMCDSANNATNTHKLHLSVDKRDYVALLDTGILNQFIQDDIVKNGERLESPVLFRYKIVDPAYIKVYVQTARRAEKYLSQFFALVEDYRTIKPGDYTRQAQSYHAIAAVFAQLVKLTSGLNGCFRVINPYLEATDEAYNVLKTKAYKEFNEVKESILRVEREVQVTLYIRVDANPEALIQLVHNLESIISKTGARAVPCPATDLPLTRYVSFRPDRAHISGPYIEADDPRLPALLEATAKSDLYRSLYNSISPKCKTKLS